MTTNRDDELRLEFQRLMNNLTNDITKSLVLPAVKSEFDVITDNQKNFINKAYSDILHASEKITSDIVSELEEILKNNIDEVKDYKATIEKLNKLNTDFSEKINEYFYNSDVIDMYEKIVSLNNELNNNIAKIESVINTFKNEHQILLTKNQEYLRQVDKAIKELDIKIPEINAKIEELTNNNSNVIKSLEDKIILFKEEIRKSNSKNFGDVLDTGYKITNGIEKLNDSIASTNSNIITASSSIKDAINSESERIDVKINDLNRRIESLETWLDSKFNMVASDIEGINTFAKKKLNRIAILNTVLNMIAISLIVFILYKLKTV